MTDRREIGMIEGLKVEERLNDLPDHASRVIDITQNTATQLRSASFLLYGDGSLGIRVTDEEPSKVSVYTTLGGKEVLELLLKELYG